MNTLRSRCRIFLLLAILAVGISGIAQAAALDCDALRAANGGNKANKMAYVTTTEKAVIFTFGGITRQSSVVDILNRMAANNMGGTFFVTEKELKRNADTVQLIVNYGQELGIGISSSADKGFADYCQEINRIQDTMEQRYGVRPKFVRQMFGQESDELREAVSAMGCQLIGQTVNVVQTRDKDAASSDEIMPKIFGKWVTKLLQKI